VHDIVALSLSKRGIEGIIAPSLCLMIYSSAERRKQASPLVENNPKCSWGWL